MPPPPDIIPKRLLSHLDQVGGVHWVRGKRSGQLTGVAPPPPAWVVGSEPGREHWGLILAKLVWVRPRDVHFSQDHCYPISYLPQPCNGTNT